MQSSQSSGHTTMPLKRKFEMVMSETSNRQQLTPYELDVFDVAMRRNTIAHIDTDAGKSMIAVMVIKEVAVSVTKQSCEKRLIILLGPTRDHVEQQFSVVRETTDLRVDLYHGSKVTCFDRKKIDEWDVAVWEHETNKNQVMVMTPQILLDALRKGFMNFEMICLLIIDECHEASGSNPYASIMKEFYFKSVNKPKVFGMTASPVTKKGVSLAKDRKAEITALESILDSKVYTIQNKTELENVTPSGSLKYSFYQPNKVYNVDLKDKLTSSQLKFEAQLLKLQLALQRHYKDSDEKHENLRKRLSNDHSTIVYCIDELGLLCAYEAVKVCTQNALKAIEECDFFKDSCSNCLYFLEESLSIIENSLPNGHENIFDAGCDFEYMVAAGFISPKLHQLCKLFLSFRGATKVSCIIFVERIITAQVLDMILKRVPHLVDLLFATEVVEEGIDVPTCSTVIRFDIPKTVQSNIQLMGWARQRGSHFIIMLERGNEKQREHVCDIIRSDHAMNDNAKKRDPDTHVEKPCNFEGTVSHYVEATGGVQVTNNSSVSVINRDSGELPADKSLSLPKQLVCLEDSKKLNQVGALTDHLRPHNENPSEGDSSKNTKESPSGAGRIPQPAAAHTSIANKCSMEEATDSKVEIPVIKPISTKKGGPRTTLYELCRKMQWPMPILNSSEQKSKNIIEFGEGVNKRASFNIFESQISLTIPDCGIIELKGEPCADKKSSYDSAALLMIYELRRLGKLIIE